MVIKEHMSHMRKLNSYLIAVSTKRVLNKYTKYMLSISIKELRLWNEFSFWSIKYINVYYEHKKEYW